MDLCGYRESCFEIGTFKTGKIRGCKHLNTRKVKHANTVEKEYCSKTNRTVFVYETAKEREIGEKIKEW